MPRTSKLIEVVVARMGAQGGNGLWPVYGWRVNDPRKKAVVFHVGREAARDLTKMAQVATFEDPIIAEVEADAWAFVHPLIGKEAA